jgi:cytochrome c556
MRNRKGSLLVIAGVAGAMMTAGWAAADDESALHKIMEKVQVNNATILKGTRSKVNFAKSKDDVVTAGHELIKLAKEARKETGPAKEKSEPQSKWEGLMDSFVKETEGWVKATSASDATQEKAKTGYRAVSKSCTECHMVFRPDIE